MEQLRPVRCPGCGGLLMRLRGQAETKCRKCKRTIEINTEQRPMARWADETKSAGESADRRGEPRTAGAFSMAKQ
ncbi:MAG: hypothetical protein IJD21_09810 [Oscillospiraceae bacterium]|nr:hypothetical protein [Oscillospiraceae bacterium]